MKKTISFMLALISVLLITVPAFADEPCEAGEACFAFEEVTEAVAEEFPEETTEKTGEETAEEFTAESEEELTQAAAEEITEINTEEAETEIPAETEITAENEEIIITEETAETAEEISFEEETALPEETRENCEDGMCIQTQSLAETAEAAEAAETSEQSVLDDAVAVMYLCVSGPHKRYPFGHTWICIKNISSESISIGSSAAAPGEMLSFGLHHFDGMHYDDEMYDYSGETVKAKERLLTRRDLKTAEKEIIRSKWHWYEFLSHNCTNFATAVWNGVTGQSYFAFCFPFVVKMQMKKGGLGFLKMNRYGND